VLDRARAGVDDEVATEVVVDGDVRRGLVEAARGPRPARARQQGHVRTVPAARLGREPVTHEVPTDLLLVNTTR
jgi:hypothetical protein